MGSQVEIVKSFLLDLFQGIDHNRRRKIVADLTENDLYVLLHENASANNPAPFERVDQFILALWKYWKEEMARIERAMPEFKWRDVEHQVCFVVSDVNRDGKFFESGFSRFACWCYCWDSNNVWVSVADEEIYIKLI